MAPPAVAGVAVGVVADVAVGVAAWNQVLPAVGVEAQLPAAVASVAVSGDLYLA